MSSDFFSVLSFILKSGYAFLTSFNIPGTNFTPLSAILFASFFSLMFSTINTIFKRTPKIHSAPKSKSE